MLFGCALFAACLFVYVFYQPGEVETGEEKTRLMLSAGAQGGDLRKPARPQLRVQGRQAERADYAVQRASLEDEAAAILAEMESIEKARAVVRHGTRRAGVRQEGGHEGGREPRSSKGTALAPSRLESGLQP